MVDGLLLLASEPITDDSGRPTLSFQRKWQELMSRLVVAEELIASLPSEYVQRADGQGWSAWSGTADRTSKVAYTATAISDPPTQAQVAAISTALQSVSRAFKAKLDDDLANGVNG